jgi:hypothetical protein
MKPPAHIPHLIHSTTLTSALTSPRLFPRDLLRRKSTARPVGTSLNLNLILNLNLNLKLFMYSIIHVFYYSIIPQPPPLDPAGPATLQSPRPTRRNFAQPQPFDRLRATPQP